MASSESAWVIEKDLVREERKDSQPMEKMAVKRWVWKALGREQARFLHGQYTFHCDICVTHASLSHR